ncbi:hypothetical protein B0H11DRAFT_2128622 [Mycena galericulata]|nr:hypothetical protein B0H11DRAFT_2128622 [Mycena galericulata]
MQIEITAFGFEGRHVKITMRRPIPSDAWRSNDTLLLWVTAVARELVNEVKHSSKWRCSECGKPARETQFDILPYMHLPEPQMMIYVHQLCEAKDGPCDRSARAESDVWRKDVGFPPNLPNSTRNINPVVQYGGHLAPLIILYIYTLFRVILACFLSPSCFMSILLSSRKPLDPTRGITRRLEGQE